MEAGEGVALDALQFIVTDDPAGANQMQIRTRNPDGWMDGWMDTHKLNNLVRLDGWNDGWMDGWTD